jgi:hypothetical protein
MSLKVKRIIFETYIKVIRNSVGANIFRNYYALVDGKKKDVMQDGTFSCAFFASFVLKLFDLIDGFHWTVEGTIRDMEKNGWYKIKRPKVGSVIIWEKEFSKNDGNWHKHIGFYIGNKKAISNDPFKKKTPQIHSYNYNGKRKIEAIYWNDKLIKNNGV